MTVWQGRRVYVDTSAMGLLLMGQPGAVQLSEWLNQEGPELVSSDLLEIELRRVAVREGTDQAEVIELLDGISLASLDRSVFRNAGMLPFSSLRTLDALHLESALRLSADAVLTYDNRLAKAARLLGLDVLAPR